MSDLPLEGFPLRGEGLANWLRTAGSKVFSEFGSFAQGLDFLREQGVSIRTQTFGEIGREVLGLVKYQRPLEALRDDSLVPIGYTNYSHHLKLADNFLYRVDITGTDPVTGEAKSRFVSVYSNTQLTKGSVLSQAAALVSGLENTYGIMPEKFQLLQALGRAETDEFDFSE